MGSIPTEVKLFSLPRASPSGLFMGLSSTLIYTSELILCPLFVFPVLRSTTFICTHNMKGVFNTLYCFYGNLLCHRDYHYWFTNGWENSDSVCKSFPYFSHEPFSRQSFSFPLCFSLRPHSSSFISANHKFKQYIKNFRLVSESC